jgi:superoxide dismutase
MKRTIVILSSIALFAAIAFAQTSPAQQNPEKLSKQQLATLISTAKTPAEHSRIAQYYGAQAQSDLAQAQEHEQMAAQFKSNPATSSSKNAAGTVNHCEYLAQHLKASAAENQKLAQEHEQMAREAGQK